MSAKIVERLAKASNPGFRCVRAGGDTSGKKFLALVRHVLNPPASSESIDRVHQRLGAHADEVAALYKLHDGFLLYCDTQSEAVGIELLPVAQWEAATDDMRECFAYLVGNPENDPDHIVSGIAFATVPCSENYFVMPQDGPNAGKVFYADHDGWYEGAFADGFGSFLIRVTQDPVKLLTDDVGCYTRYSDGETDAQWIPEEYFDDVSKSK